MQQNSVKTKGFEIMNEQYFNKLREWYKGCDFQRYLVIQSSKQDVLLLVAIRNPEKHFVFELVRIFNVGGSIQISVDQSMDISDCENTFDSTAELIKTAIRVS